MANFRTKARAIDLLGKNQIADLPTAITELWKNGYDAYGDCLAARLYHSGYKDILHETFLISDDGRGMDMEDILNKWIVIGTGNKRNENVVLSAEERLYKKERVPLGEKGIGRLSVAYLGNHMLMFSKKQHSGIQMLFMNWKILENYEMYLDEVEIPLTEIDSMKESDLAYEKLEKEFGRNFQSPSWSGFEKIKDEIINELAKYQRIPDAIKEVVEDHFERYGHGTIFVIFDPIQELRELEKENSAEVVVEEERERYKEQTNYIRSALSGLFNPFDEKLVEERQINLDRTLNRRDEESPCFMIYGYDGEINKAHDFLQLKEPFTEADFEDCEHWITGFFDTDGRFEGKIKTYNNIIRDYKFKPRNKLQTRIGKLDLKIAFWEANKKNSIMPEDKWKIYENKAGNYGGLAIYRDGFRVLPYGRVDFDFLGLEENRSKGAGYYYFSHRKMFGYVGISKLGNPKLIDKSGREGLVSNDAYRCFRGLLKEFLKEVAINYFGTKSEERKQFTQQQDRKRKQEELIANEKKKNRKQLRELSQKLKDQQKKLNDLEVEIKDLQVCLDEKIRKKQLIKSEERDLLSKISQVQMQLMNARTVVSPDLSLEGNEDVQNLYYSYENRRNEMEKAVTNLNKMVMDHVQKNGLEEEYREHYRKMLKELNSQIANCEEDLDETIAQIRKDITKIVENIQLRFREMSPDTISLEDLDEEKTREYLLKLDALYGDLSNICNSQLKSYLQRLKTVDPEENEGTILEAYKSKEIELSNRLDTFYELAQVGMSIDIIDHQFNVIYSEISENLREMSALTKNNVKLGELCNSVKVMFQHMESNHKMLMPLYRNTRRYKKSISGADIKNVLLSFYERSMKKSGIQFECTTQFLQKQYYTYESMLLPVFINIINNALYWVIFSEKRIIRIDALNDRTMIMNSGPQMTYTELEKCFEIFYTKKPSGRGIGLYLAKRNLNTIDMDIYATNDKNLNQLGGACFVIMDEYEGE